MRIKPLKLGLVGAALAGCLGLAVSYFGSDSPEDPTSDAATSRARLASRLRPHSVPRFATAEQPAPPLAPPPPPPVFEALTPPPLAPLPPPTPEEELRTRASKDGYVFREAGSSTVYLVQNGTKFQVQNDQELLALGYTPGHVEEVPSGLLSFLRDRPPEKTLLRERDQLAVFYYENGQKRYITSAPTFERLGHKWSDIKVVPKGSLNREATGAPIQ